MSEETTYFRNRRGTVFPDRDREAFALGDITPVVVIDPEDGERVEAIVASARTFDRSAGCRAVRNLLRSWTKPVAPPKPDEPTGLHAVVRDREGRIWQRPNSHHLWQCGWLPSAWADLDIPEDGVLFKGVES